MSIMNKLCKSINEAFPGASICQNVDLSRHTSFRTGGCAAALLDAQNAQEIMSALVLAENYGVPFFIIGNGTNLLISDKGLDALVIRISDRMNAIRAEGNCFEAEAGVSLSAFAKNTVESGFTGLEWASGIPGTVGGAIAMNAGAYGGEISYVIKKVTVVENGEIRKIDIGPGDFGYRKSAFRAPERTVISACFELLEDDGGAVRRMKEYSRARREKQPLGYPSAGSTFKRPEGHFTGRLIENAGLKGVTVGGAQVSELHAGFIINKGGATSADIYALIQLVQNRVYEASGVSLETEVMLLGNFD